MAVRRKSTNKPDPKDVSSGRSLFFLAFVQGNHSCDRLLSKLLLKHLGI
jgi:hypothetical protein